MVVDSLKHCDLYTGLHRDFSKVFEVLKKIANGEIEEKTVLVDGSVWVNAPSEVMEISEPRFYEAHRDFIDIHYIASGAEKFGYSNVDQLKTVEEYNEPEDYELLDGDKQFITLNEGEFCIVFPQEAHIPVKQRIGNNKLIRVVAKIRK